MADNPYVSLPSKAFWRRSVASMSAGDVDPVGTFDLSLSPSTKVATAGSCFAQHIARHLKASGFNYYVAEEGHPLMPEHVRVANNYSTFSARFGNIYTARQLLQLFERAYGRFAPKEGPWVDPDGTVRDPFRPTVQPGNFVSAAEMLVDREQHFAAVRRMFETLDVFVFTLGLTECWRARADGAVFPICPGVDGGAFDPRYCRFYNQTYVDVVNDMRAFIDGLKAVNPAARVILTVSPVPLMATAAPDAHVLSATTYSKSVLRVAAETLRLQYDFVHYFPSYEIITGAFNRGRYYADDLRNVTEEGVSHVMRLFLKYAAGEHELTAAANQPRKKSEDEKRVEEFAAQAAAFVAVECDEEKLDSARH
ncbi:GSCFA domain-containing protein [Aestuariivirga sp.]|uniref:GSCFA domain-containing protein n=1 Tax=Aestuariivirga sp. TaxID=2650926 RepID=UPI003593ABA5